MSVFVFLMRCQFFNTIKRLKKNPKKILVPLGLILYLSFWLFAQISGKRPNLETGPEIIQAIILGLILLFTQFRWQTTIEKGSSAFTMPDTQFLLTSPLKPQKILCYCIFKSSLSVFMGSLIIIGYNIYRIKHLLRVNFIFLICCLLLLICSVEVVSIFLYMLKEVFQRYKKFLSYGLLIFPLLILLLFLEQFIKNQDLAFLEQLKIFLGSDFYVFLPIVGWMYLLASSLFIGASSITWISLGCLLGSSSLMLLLIYRWQADFYEDALNSAQKTQKIQEKVKEIEKNQTNYIYNEHTKYKISDTGIKHGWGGTALFFRALCERKKIKKYWPFSMGVIVQCLIAVSIYLLVMKSLGGEEIQIQNMQVPLEFSLLIYLLLNLYIKLFSGSFSEQYFTDLYSPTLYLFPEKPYKKIWVLTWLPLLNRAVTYLPAFILLAALCHSPLVFSFACFLFLCSMDLIALGSTIFMMWLMGSGKGIIKSWIMVILQIFFYAPCLILFGSGLYIYLFSRDYQAYLLFFSTIALNVGLYFLLLLAGKSIIKRGL